MRAILRCDFVRDIHCVVHSNDNDTDAQLELATTECELMLDYYFMKFAHTTRGKEPFSFCSFGDQFSCRDACVCTYVDNRHQLDSSALHQSTFRVVAAVVVIPNEEKEAEKLKKMSFCFRFCFHFCFVSLFCVIKDEQHNQFSG